jgi:TPR repeat protein
VPKITRKQIEVPRNSTGIDWAREPNIEGLNRARDLLAVAPDRARLHLEALAKRGSIMAMIYLAEAYFRGTELPGDREKVDLWYGRATDAGSIQASCYQGWLKTIDGDFAKAVELYEIGVRANFTPSIYRLGRMYYSGLGVEKDLFRAMTLLERAAVLGHVYATRDIAWMMIYGKYGLLNIPCGLYLLLANLKFLIRVKMTNPNSEFLRRS